MALVYHQGRFFGGIWGGRLPPPLFGRAPKVVRSWPPQVVQRRGEKRNKENKEEEEKKEEQEKQSQKRYMVSGSLCPLISFSDVSFSVIFLVRGQRPRRGR